MPKYIALMNWTDKGMADIKNSPERTEQARRLAEVMGGKVEHVYMTLGNYDLVAILEMPNDELASELALKIGAAGNIRTTTMKAFDEASFRKIIGNL